MASLDSLNPEILRKLYEKDLLLDSQIAEQFGTYQVQINRLRKKWDIPTISKTDRIEMQLPPITETQDQLLVGSLLGDGHLSAASSNETARFSENHSLKQQEYLLWKAEILGPYVTHVIDVKKTDKITGKIYMGKTLTTKMCRQFRPYYELFYPASERKRVFPKKLSKIMAPMVLAIWYMDDGSLCNNQPRITFGLDSVSLERGLKALRKLGLKPVVYDEKTPTIHFPKQTEKFFGLIEPHMPSCMHYKIPVVTPKMEIDRNARKLTPEIAGGLFSNGVAASKIAEIYGVGTSTVRRRLAKSFSVKPQKLPRSIAKEALGNFDPKQWVNLSESDRTQWVEDVYSILRRIDFPCLSPMGTDDAKREFDKLVQKPVSLVDGRISPVSPFGLKLCGGYFPNRFEARYKSQRTTYEAWHTEEELKRAVRYQFSVGDPVVPYRVLKAVSMRFRTPTIFRPIMSKYIYQTYAKENLPVWDCCAGYGGRMLGALSVGLKYIGTDVDPRTIKGNQKLAEVLGKLAQVNLHLNPAETFDPGVELGLVFTSPPYFNREKYSDLDGQSWVQYGTLETWVDGFLRPIFSTAHRWLVPEGYLVINIADLKEGKKIISLVDITKKMALDSGFSYEHTITMPMASLNRKRKKHGEPVLVFKKPAQTA